jgi:hypothetical protein
MQQTIFLHKQVFTQQTTALQYGNNQFTSGSQQQQSLEYDLLMTTITGASEKYTIIGKPLNNFKTLIQLKSISKVLNCKSVLHSVLTYT